MPIFAYDGQMGVQYKTGDETGFVNSLRGGRMENVTYQRSTHEGCLEKLARGDMVTGHHMHPVVDLRQAV
jgi:hypothetical protein